MRSDQSARIVDGTARILEGIDGINFDPDTVHVLNPETSAPVCWTAIPDDEIVAHVCVAPADAHAANCQACLVPIHRAHAIPDSSNGIYPDLEVPLCHYAEAMRTDPKPTVDQWLVAADNGMYPLEDGQTTGDNARVTCKPCLELIHG